MKYAVVKPELCDRSPGCPPIRICPFQAVSHKKIKGFMYEASVIDKNACTGCGKCINYCPGGAIKMVSEEKSA